MSNLVFVSGDYCSGSTLLFTLFRKAGGFCCLYEPLHEQLPEYLHWDRPDDGLDHHFFVDSYYREMRKFARIPELHRPEWSAHGLYLAPDAEADGLYRYLSYLIGSAFGVSPRVMIKENRISFRLGWIRAHFPTAKIVHVYRDKESQWKSNVRRAQEYTRRQDVGQDRTDYNGFSVAAWCEDLKPIFPELDAGRFRTGFERFAALWERSFAENRRYADISIDYRDLIRDFDAAWVRLWTAVGGPPVEVEALKPFVVPPERQQDLVRPRSAVRRYADRVIDRVGWKYAQARLRLRATLQQRGG